MEPEYILGNEQTLENMQKMEAFAPFSEETVDFLDRLSKALMKHKKAKGFPDVITFAFWCRKASVLEMKKQVSWLPDAEERGVFGRGAPNMGQGIVHAVFPEFALDVEVAVGHDVIVRGTGLNHIILHDPAPAQTIKEATFGDPGKALHCQWGIRRE